MDVSQLPLSRYISHLWTLIPDKDINVCRLYGRLNSDIIRHSVAECRVTLTLKEHFINWVKDEVSIEFYNELVTCDAEHFLDKVLGAVYETLISDEHFNNLRAVGFCA